MAVRTHFLPCILDQQSLRNLIFCKSARRARLALFRSLKKASFKLAMKDIQHILSQVQYMYQNPGYKSLRPVYVLALCLPLDNATCERGLSVMNEIKTAKRNHQDKPLVPLMFIVIYKDFKHNCAELGSLIADTWVRN